MNTKILFIYLCGIFVVTFSCTKVRQHDDNQRTAVFDSIGLLGDVETKRLSTLIRNLELERGPQIAVLVIDTLNGMKIEEYSLSVFENLKLGREKYKDGLMITVALKNREMRIEVGYGLEEIIRDDIAARIIKEDMAPKFREKKYDEGIELAIRKMSDLIVKNEGLIGKIPF